MEPKDIEMINNSENSLEELSLCEQRIISDIAECKRSKLVGTVCKILLKDYKKNNNGEFELIIEYISYFSVKFIFNSEYPISPPSAIYNSGLKIKNIFDNNGNVLIETLKKENWNKGIWLSTLIFYIELLISKEKEEKNDSSIDSSHNTNKNKKEKYGKRNWQNYVNEENEPKLEINLKKEKK